MIKNSRLAPGPKNDYGDDPDYLIDAFARRHSKEALAAKVAKAWNDGNLEYAFSSISAEKRPRELLNRAGDLSDEQFWHFVRKFWTADCSRSSDYIETLLGFLQSERPSRHSVMKEHEHAVFEQLDTEFPVFRGGKKDGLKKGWSWTLNEGIARAHAVTVSEVNATVVRGRCKKAEVLAFFQFGGLDEEEIVINPDRVFQKEQRRAFSKVREETDGVPPWEPFNG